MNIVRFHGMKEYTGFVLITRRDNPWDGIRLLEIAIGCHRLYQNTCLVFVEMKECQVVGPLQGWIEPGVVSCGYGLYWQVPLVFEMKERERYMPITLLSKNNVFSCKHPLYSINALLQGLPKQLFIQQDKKTRNSPMFRTFKPGHDTITQRTDTYTIGNTALTMIFSKGKPSFILIQPKKCPSYLSNPSPGTSNHPAFSLRKI